MSEYPSDATPTPSLLQRRRAVGHDVLQRPLNMSELVEHLDILRRLIVRAIQRDVQRLRKSLNRGRASGKVYFALRSISLVPWYSHVLEIEWGYRDDSHERASVPLRLVPSQRSAGPFLWEVLVAPTELGESHRSLTSGRCFSSLAAVTEFVARHMLIACEICEEPVAPTFSDSDEDPDNFVPVDVCAGSDLADK